MQPSRFVYIAVFLSIMPSLNGCGEPPGPDALEDSSAFQPRFESSNQGPEEGSSLFGWEDMPPPVGGPAPTPAEESSSLFGWEDMPPPFGGPAPTPAEESGVAD